MTSKISFSKLVKRTIKEQTALIFASCVYAIWGVMQTIFALQYAFNMVDFSGPSSTSMDVYIAEIFSPSKSLTGTIFSVILASFFAFAGLRHLHSKTQSDFYGSLPIKRKTQLSVIATSCFIIYLIPLLVQYIINIIATSMTGYMSVLALKYMILNILLQIVTYFLTWFTAALAVVLTGHIFIGLLGLGVFLGYCPIVLRYLVPCFAGQFFNTYVDMTDSMNRGGLNVFEYLSPVSISALMTNSFAAGKWTFAGQSFYLAIALLELLVVAVLTYYLYKKRPAEAAGNAMTFPKWNTFWSILFIVPLALYTGFFFSEIAYGNSKAWILPGTILGIVIFGVIIECLFEFDIRAVFHHKRRFAASFILCMLFLACFQFDILGFDSWTPSREDVTNIAFDYYGLSFKSSDAIGRYIEDEDLKKTFTEKHGMSGDELDAAYELAMSYAAQGNVDGNSIGDDLDEATGTYHQTVRVTYTMKNGREKKRAYYVEISPDDPLLQAVYKTEDFKDDIFIQYSLSPEIIKKAVWYNGSEYVALNFNEDEINQFLDAYKQDVNNMKLEELLFTNPMSTVRLTVDDSDYDSYIYASFENVEKFLAKYNISATSSMFQAEDVSTITIQGVDYSSAKEGREIKKTISDRSQIEKLLPYLVNMELGMETLASENSINYDYTIEVHTKNAVVYSNLTNEGIEVLNSLN